MHRQQPHSLLSETKIRRVFEQQQMFSTTQLRSKFPNLLHQQSVRPNQARLLYILGIMTKTNVPHVGTGMVFTSTEAFLLTSF